MSVKERSVPKAHPGRVGKLVYLQKFDSSESNSLRYHEFIFLLLLIWISQPNMQVTSSTVYEKLHELFGSESNYKSVTHDINIRKERRNFRNTT